MDDPGGPFPLRWLVRRVLKALSLIGAGTFVWSALQTLPLPPLAEIAGNPAELAAGLCSALEELREADPDQDYPALQTEVLDWCASHASQPEPGQPDPGR